MDNPQISVGAAVELLIPEYAGVEGVVWEVGDEHLAILRCEDYSPIQTPIYVEMDRVSYDLRKLPTVRSAPTKMHWIPSGTTFALQTWNPRPADYDFADIHIWHTTDDSMMELRQTRFTGVLGVSDGTFCSHRRLTSDESRDIQNEFNKIDFWDLDHDDGKRQAGGNEFWNLSVYDSGREHSVDRHTVPNVIQPLCQLCYDLAARDGLIDGSVLDAENDA